MEDCNNIKLVDKEYDLWFFISVLNRSLSVSTRCNASSAELFRWFHECVMIISGTLCDVCGSPNCAHSNQCHCPREKERGYIRNHFFKTEQERYLAAKQDLTNIFYTARLSGSKFDFEA